MPTVMMMHAAAINRYFHASDFGAGGRSQCSNIIPTGATFAIPAKYSCDDFGA
jgi:hypothetical protein